MFLIDNYTVSFVSCLWGAFLGVFSTLVLRNIRKLCFSTSYYKDKLKSMKEIEMKNKYCSRVEQKKKV